MLPPIASDKDSAGFSFAFSALGEALHGVVHLVSNQDKCIGLNTIDQISWHAGQSGDGAGLPSFVW